MVHRLQKPIETNSRCMQVETQKYMACRLYPQQWQLKLQLSQHVNHLEHAKPAQPSIPSSSMYFVRAKEYWLKRPINIALTCTQLLGCMRIRRNREEVSVARAVHGLATWARHAGVASRIHKLGVSELASGTSGDWQVDWVIYRRMYACPTGRKVEAIRWRRRKEPPRYIYVVEFLKVLESVSNQIFYIVVLSSIIVVALRPWPIMPADLQKFYDEFVAQAGFKWNVSCPLTCAYQSW